MENSGEIQPVKVTSLREAFKPAGTLRHRDFSGELNSTTDLRQKIPKHSKIVHKCLFFQLVHQGLVSSSIYF